ncbi:MAG: peptide chain release factor N(5)-glutamine methyltransferase [Gammaproteobacteria bacterium]|nr:peptide chain release factor N(5)-glutamine methyltransferase [Gammaproteobacteria bacterium]MCD8542971.1 peptide chain release factor N(5)-glutamine methyltransferase [Gammaproteobacteria bacterium]
MQIKNLLYSAVHQLSTASKTPRLDAELLLAYVLNKDRAYLFSSPEYCVNPEQYEIWKNLLAQRQQKIPMAYLLGQKEFWGMMLEVNPHVLIPRPETEQFLEIVLNNKYNTAAVSVLDLGTGSGALALAMAKERKNWCITAVDRSIDALNVAKRNAAKHGLNNIVFLCSDWFSELSSLTFDIIVSNPPYIAPDDMHLWTEEIYHEPREALVSLDHGLADIKNIIVNSRDHLNPDGYLFIEHGWQQGEKVRKLFDAHAYFDSQTFRDLSDIDRVTMARF